jgi:hypothetical protein
MIISWPHIHNPHIWELAIRALILYPGILLWAISGLVKKLKGKIHNPSNYNVS